jgi:hypothetical protein
LKWSWVRGGNSALATGDRTSFLAFPIALNSHLRGALEGPLVSDLADAKGATRSISNHAVISFARSANEIIVKKKQFAVQEHFGRNVRVR